MNSGIGRKLLLGPAHSLTPLPYLVAAHFDCLIHAGKLRVRIGVVKILIVKVVKCSVTKSGNH